MPDVPNEPGVPALSSFADDVVTLLVDDLVSFLFGAPSNTWGIFLNGEEAFDFDSFNSISFRKEFVIADYPVEAATAGGTASSSFVSYDKVELPFECRVRLVSGGTEQQREALLSQVEAAASTLDLYDVVTPEKLYSNCNVERYTYERTSEDGVGMMKIDVTFKQVRSSAASSFTNTQQPGSASQQGLGNVQPTSAVPGAAPTNISGPGNVQGFPIQDVQ